MSNLAGSLSDFEVVEVVGMAIDEELEPDEGRTEGKLSL
jgi:hypothetical protein